LGEVEIEVGATGLNFKEVLGALGLIPVPTDFIFKFGLECAGTITALGEGVEGFEIGDEVIAFGSSCFSQFITTSANLVAPKPKHLSLEEAATIPIAFATAYYSLIKMGRLCQGESVLIHSAGGGVGMAAVQIAQWVGAEIFATAGRPEKREFLRSLGIEHVMDSRSLDFADEVIKCTNGRGVDVVLNSLGAEFIPKSLSVLARYGRFLEIGLRDILNDSPLGLRPFEKRLSFFAIQVEPEAPNFSSMWQEVVQHFKEGNFSPLPHRVFPITEVASAFEYMAQAKHIGKVVVSLQDKDALRKLVTSAQGVSQEVRDSVTSPVSLRSGSSNLSSVNSGSLRKTAVSPNKLQRDLFKEGLLPSEGIKVFRRILGSKLPQVLVSTHDFQARVEQHNAGSELFSLEAIEKTNISEEKTSNSEPTHPRPELSNTYISPQNEVEQTVADLWKQLIGIEQVGIYDNFFELGGTSLLAVQSVSRLREIFQVDLSLNSHLSEATIAGVAKEIAEKLPQQEELDETNQLLAEIESLSLHEVKEQLTQESGTIT
jgi:NADPH:quinone reductase-like Zn-dependent oxidoreductase/acyl carrier protein